MKVTTIGSALIDVFISSKHFVISDDEGQMFSCQSASGKLEVDSFGIKTGGGGTNTAVGFARLGFETSCVAELGIDELAEVVVQDLEKNGVATDQLIHERKEETGGSVLLVCAGGERTALVHRGAAAMLDPHDLDEDFLSQQDWLHLSSLSGRVDTVRAICDVVKKNQIGFSWNPGTAVLEAIADGSFSVNDITAQILVLNKEEWAIIEEKHEAIRQQVRTIVVTDSVRGGLVIHQNEEYPYEAITTEAVDNTGAGDAFTVGFVAARLRDQEIETAIDWGRKNASSVVQQVGAKPGLLDRESLLA